MRSLNIDYLAYYSAHIDQLTVRGKQATGLCPFHEDHHPSLSLNLERGLFKCHACGKQGNAVQFQALLDQTDTKTAYRTLAAAAIQSRNVGRQSSTDPTGQRAPSTRKARGSGFARDGQASASDTTSVDDDALVVTRCHHINSRTTIYPYLDEQGTVLYELVRIDSQRGKRYYYQHTPPFARSPIHKKPDRRVPYALPWLLQKQNQGGLLFLVEGEKCAQMLLDAGLLATTTGSASSYDEWGDLHMQMAEPYDVILLPDYDRPGRHYMQELAARLSGHVKSLRLLELWTVFPEMKEKEDIADLLERGLTAAELVQLAVGQPEQQVELDDRILLDYPLNDQGNAGRLLALHGDRMRYCPQLGKWYCWDGGRWRPDTNGQALRIAMDTAERYRHAAENATYAQRKFALTSGNLIRLEAMLKTAAALHHVEADKLDAAENLFCLGEQTVELPTGTLRPSRPDDWNTRSADCIRLQSGPAETMGQGTQAAHHAQANGHQEYISTQVSSVSQNASRGTLPDCKRPQSGTAETIGQGTQAAHYTNSPPKPEVFLQFIHRIFGGNQELIAYLQRALGYCLTGSTCEQVFFIAWGDGANGKSTLIDLISDLMGDYAQTIPAEALMGFSRGGPSPELASISGARLVTVNESGDACRLNEGLIKQLTGNDLVYARPLYSQGFSYRPRFKLWISTNHKPIINGADYGIWRRIHLIPFSVTIPPREIDRHLPQKLRAEAAGIMQWLQEGAKQWYQIGLQPPQIVQNAVLDYKCEMDRIDDFFASCILPQPQGMVSARTLYAAYQTYCEELATKPRTQTFFGRRVAAMGFERVKTPTVHYLGLELSS